MKTNAKAKKGGLGRSLEALLSDVGQEVLAQPQVDVLKHIEISRIRAGGYQPRQHFDEAALAELAQSIAEHGIVQPLVVRQVAGDKYEIIAGERRFRAGQQAGLRKVPCIIKQYNDKQALAVALIENLQRSDLNVLELAQGLQSLVKDFSLTHEDVAQLVGRSRSAVSNTLRLLELSEPVKKALGEGKVEMGHARALLTLDDGQQYALLTEIVRRGLTVRQTEEKARLLREGEAEKTDKGNQAAKSVDIENLERRVSEWMKVAVSIQHRAKGNGKLILQYQDLDELDDILARWGLK